MDDAIKDVEPGHSITCGRGYRTGYWLGELQAAMRPGLVVVADVMGEYYLEVSS